MVVHDIIVLETFIILLMTLALGFMIVRRKKVILSAKGKKRLHDNVGSIKRAILVLVVSMLLYLFSETAEIIGELFEDFQDVAAYESAHANLEAAHLFVLIIGLVMFLQIVGKVGEE